MQYRLPKVSIVTVSYNSVSSIEKTIESVISQNYPCIEYIVIDGGSADGTYEIIKRYASRINYWVSEADDGIYDAMNKGQEVATGDYIFFLNTGDVFFDSEVVKNVFSSLPANNFNDILMGKIQCIHQERLFWVAYGKSLPSPYYSPPHQAMFIPKSIYKNYKFDIRLRVLSDRAYWLKLLNAGKYNVKNVDYFITYYSLDGISGRPSIIVWFESLIISYFYTSKVNLVSLAKSFTKEIIKLLVYRILGVKLYYLISYFFKK